MKTELEQNIWDECARFLTNCIIFYNAYILSALLTEAEKAGRTDESEIIKRISPIAWRHVNFLGRFVFQRTQNPLDIDAMIKTLEQEIKWQTQEPPDEVLT